MRRFRGCLALAAVFLAASPALSEKKPAIAYQPELWKITSGESTLYLLGSIHAGVPEMYPLPAPIETAFAASRLLLVESYEPPGAHDEAATEQLVEARGLYPDGDLLRNHIDADTRRRLDSYLKKNRKFLEQIDLTRENIGQLRPWAVAILVNLTPALSTGMTGEFGIDTHFVQEAEKSGKPITGIETASFQFDLLSDYPDDLQAKWLAATLGAKVDTSAINQRMLADRNPHMADAAEKELKSGGQVFMVVGTAHVDGDGGIVRMLEKRGYAVIREAVAK